MNSSTVMAPYLLEYHRKRSQLHAKVIANEQQRLTLDEKCRQMLSIDQRLKSREESEQFQTTFARLSRESQQAEQRHLRLLNELTEAERKLDQIRIDADHLIRLREDYLTYLERTPTQGISTVYDFSRSRLKSNESHDEPSTSEQTFSRSKRSGSLRMDLTRQGLEFLLNYLENELKDSIDKKKFYHYDPPTLTQKQSILNIANEKKSSALKDLDPSTTSMFILDQLASTIRRTTKSQCLFTEEILSANIKDLNKQRLAQMLPEEDQSLWLRLIEHWTKLYQSHVMNAENLANKFAPLLLNNKMSYEQGKAKELLKHLIEQSTIVQNQISNDEREQTSVRAAVKSPSPRLSTWKTTRGMIDDDLDDDETYSASTLPTSKQNITPRKVVQSNDDSDSEFYS